MSLSLGCSSKDEWCNGVLGQQLTAELQSTLANMREVEGHRRLDAGTLAALTHLMSAFGDEPLPVWDCSGVSSGASKRVVMSCFGGAQNILVDALVDALRSKGHCVWRGKEDAAGCCGADDCFSAAIEQTNTIIICASPGYKSCAICRMHAR